MEVVRELGLITCERGVFDSSFGGVPMVNYLGDDHMEEEVQVRVQVEVEREEQGIAETHGKEQGEEQRTNQTHDMDDHVDDMTRSCRHLSQCGVSHIMKHLRCAGERSDVCGVLSTLPVGYNGSPSTMKKRNWFRSLFSRFTVEMVHICQCFSEV